MDHILTNYNVADPVTKKMSSAIMNEFLETGKNNLCSEPMDLSLIGLKPDELSRSKSW